MIKINKHKLALLEENCTYFYNLLCKVEDLGINYSISDNESGIIISINDYIENYANLKEYLNNKIGDVYNNGDIVEIDPIEVMSNGEILLDKYLFNINTGTYNNIDDGKGFTFNLETVLHKYSKREIRGRSINLSNIVRKLFSFKILNNRVCESLIRSLYKYQYIELSLSVFKCEFCGENPKKDYEEFINNPEFPRCVPWSEDNKYGIWLWPERYFSNTPKDCITNKVFPDLKIIVNDTRLHNIPMKRINFSWGAGNILLKFPTLGYTILTSTSKKINPTVFYIIKDEENIEEKIRTYMRDTCFSYDRDNSIGYKDYCLNFNSKERENIKLALEASRDYGYISYFKDAREYSGVNQWKILLEMPI